MTGTTSCFRAARALIGSYNSAGSVVQGRVQIGWNRAVTPEGVSVELGGYGSDALGGSGQAGFVDSRFRQRFGSAALISLIGAGSEVIVRRDASAVQQNTAEDLGDDMEMASRGVMDDYLSLPPVIYVDQGTACDGFREPGPCALIVMDAPTSYAEQGLGALRSLLVSEDVNEVVINPDGGIWVEHVSAAHMQPWDGAIPIDQLKRLGAHLAGEAKNQLGAKHPIVSGRIHVFGQSMRVQVIVPPAIEHGVSVSIRKYVSRILDVREVEFLEGRQIDVEGARRNRLTHLGELAAAGDLAQMLRLAVDARLNILVSGGTSSGKTTLARAILSMAHPEERMVTIEDAPELRLPHRNAVGLIADRRPDSERSPARLLESTLRMRPDRLILGEIRGAEAFNFLEAINTGHPGSVSTIHADSPFLTLERMAMMVLRAGLNLSRADVIDYARATIDLVIQTGRRGGKRGVLEVFMPALA